MQAGEGPWDPRNMMVMHSLSSLYASSTPDIELEKVATGNANRCKLKRPKGSLLSLLPKDQERVLGKTRHADNSHATPAKKHRKNDGLPSPTPAKPEQPERPSLQDCPKMPQYLHQVVSRKARWAVETFVPAGQ